MRRPGQMDHTCQVCDGRCESETSVPCLDIIYSTNLCRKGYVYRQSGPGDRRAVIFGMVRMATGRLKNTATRQENKRMCGCNERQVLLVESWTKMRGTGNECDRRLQLP